MGRYGTYSLAQQVSQKENQFGQSPLKYKQFYYPIKQPGQAAGNIVGGTNPGVSNQGSFSTNNTNNLDKLSGGASNQINSNDMVLPGASNHIICNANATGVTNVCAVNNSSLNSVNFGGAPIKNQLYSPN